MMKKFIVALVLALSLSMAAPSAQAATYTRWNAPYAHVAHMYHRVCIYGFGGVGSGCKWVLN